MTEIDRESVTPFMDLKGKSTVDIKEVSFFARIGVDIRYHDLVILMISII